MRQRLTKRLRNDTGFTTVVVMGMLLVGMLLVAAAFAATDNDTATTRHDQYYKQAYDAAEAGVNYYLAHLGQDTNYWSGCYTAPIQAPGTAFSNATSQQIPSSEARYEIELLNAAGYAGSCSATVSNSVINPSTGELTIRSTGSYRGVRRSIVATFKREGFLNFLWFTNFETQDPATYLTSKTQIASCSKYARDRRPDTNPCNDQSFITGDSMNGPVHTNDEFKICGSPSFGRNGKNDSVEATDPNGYRAASGCSAIPSFNGITPTWGASNLQPPKNNLALKNYADPGWIFTGPVHIALSSTGATVTNSNGTLLKSGTVPNGVIYVQNGTCATDFSHSQGYPKGGGCGDAWVHGQANQDLTVSAENDVIVDGDLTHTTSTVVGLIATGFVRVYHPCTYGTNRTSSPEDGNTSYMSDPEIDAAILSLQHSFLVDNYGCGDPLGTLTVKGAIAQWFRGTVGEFNSDNGQVLHGYLKNYNYDSALKYHQPPYFLDPVEASWDLWSENEQVPSH